MATNNITLVQAATIAEESGQNVKVGNFDSFADFMSYFEAHYRPILEEWRDNKHLPNEHIFNFFVDDMLSAFAPDDHEG